MSTSPAFRRYRSPAFISALHELVGRPEGQWWRDALTHSDLKFAIRNDALDVYYCGASIFRVAPQDGRVVARTHFKYLVRQRQGHASLAADGRTFIDDGAPLWPAYEGRVTLEEMLDAAKPLAGPEKTGLHPLILYPRVIDLEVAFRSVRDPQKLPLLPDYEDAVTGDGAPSEERLSEGEGGPRHDRLDAVTLEERGGELWIAFSIVLVSITHFLPSILAFCRGHYRRWTILFLNIILGWTGVVWLYLLLMSLELF